MSGTGDDHYATLKIARAASPAEVKRAYFRLVKVHTPEDDPARFQAISEAYRVLSDPDARKAYDAEERLPPAVAKALARAEELVGTEPSKAVAVARAALGADPRSTAVRLHVAAICLKAGQPDAALPLAEALVRENPRRADLAEVLGDALTGAERLADAERAYRTSIGLDRRRVGAYLGLANVHDAQGREDAALAVLDRGIAGCGDADLRTLPLRVRKLYVLAQDGRWDEMERVVTSILSVVPTDDADAVQHAALQLAWLARRYDDARIYDVAKFAFDAAHRLAPFPWLKARSEEIAPHAEMAREARRAQKDPRVARWIAALIRARLGSGMSDADFRKVASKLEREMTTEVGRKDREWATFAGWYPSVADALQDIFDALRASATGEAAPVRRGRRARRGGRRTRAPAQRGLAVGGAFIALVAFGGLAASLFSDKKPEPRRDQSLERFTQSMIRNSQESLENTLADLVKREEARRGRKMTVDEARTYLDELLSKPAGSSK